MMHFAEIEGVNCKFFEILGCEGFQICDAKPGVPDLATPGKEVVTFDGVDASVEVSRRMVAQVRRVLAGDIR